MINFTVLTFLDVSLNSRERKIGDKIYSSFIVTAYSQKSLDIIREYLTRYRAPCEGECYRGEIHLNK